MTYVRSSYPHARIAGIDTEEASRQPGRARRVHERRSRAPPDRPHAADAARRHAAALLATDVVRFAGEPVAAVVAEDRYLGADAADLVVVDYDPLPPLAGDRRPRRRLILFQSRDERLLRLESPQRADFSGCEVVVTLRVENQRMTAADRGPSGAAYWTEDDRLVLLLLPGRPSGPRRAARSTTCRRSGSG